MGRLSIGPIIEGGKKVSKLIKENPKEFTAFLSLLGSGGKIIKEKTDKKNESKKDGKLHHRKERYRFYKIKVLLELDGKNRKELFHYRLEIEQFLKQIENEGNMELGVKKPIHKKRMKKWNDILIQIKDKMHTRDYLEFIEIYNNPDYHSEYFKGFEGLVEKFKKLNNQKEYDKLLTYIAKITNRNIEQIHKDFSLID